MPFRYERDDTRRQITVRLGDPFTEREAHQILDRQIADGAWSYEMMYDASDLRAPMTMSVSQAAVARLTSLVAELGPRGPVAIVAGRAPIVAASEGYALLSQRTGFCVEVFSSIEEADRWFDARSRLQL